MREIKFRGKCFDNEWVFGDLLQSNITQIIAKKEIFDSNLELERIEYEYYDVNHNTVGQYTGLKDKSGKEIYEGDLIKAPSGRIYAVIFSTWKHEEKREFPKVIDLYEHTGWCVSLDGVNPCELLDFEACQGSVIGNVYDNPELLKGGNDDHT